MKCVNPSKRFIAFLIDFSISIVFIIGIHHIYDNQEFLNELSIFVDQDFTINGFLDFLTKISTLKSLYYFLTLLGFWMIYYVFIPLLYRGKTFGKALLHIRVTTIYEQRPQFAHLFVREVLINFFFVIFSLGLVYILSFIIILTSRGNRSLADSMSNTLLMHDEFYLSRRKKRIR